MKKITLGILVSFLIFLGGCLQKNADNSKPIIKVNGKIITKNMFKKELDQVYKRSGQKQVESNDPKSKFIYLVQKNRVVNDLIVKQLVKQEAKKRQITIKKSEVDKLIDNIARSMGGQERFKASLALNKIDKATFRENIKLDLLKRKLVASVIGDSKVTEQEIKDFYEKNKDKKFKHGEEVRASHILISASESDIRIRIQGENKDITKSELDKKVSEEMNKDKEKAQKIYNEVKANPDKFAKYAKQYSEDPSSAAKGGDLGFFSKDEMVPAFSKAAFSTKPGNLSKLVKTKFGYHIIKVVDRKEGGITPLDEMKPQIKRYLKGKKKMNVFRDLIENAKKSAKIVYLDKQYDPENIKQEYRELITAIKKLQAAKSPRIRRKPFPLQPTKKPLKKINK